MGMITDCCRPERADAPGQVLEKLENMSDEDFTEVALKAAE